MKLKQLFSDRTFYKKLLIVAIPIMVQNGITNVVNMADNMMVGQVGTSEMSGVAIANQLILIMYLCLFGGVSGAGIFTAQFYGKDDAEGIRYTLRYKLYICLIIAAICIGIFTIANEPLINFYLRDTDPAEVPIAFASGTEYLRIMIFGFLPFAVMQAYAGTMRETGNTVPPMVAGIIAVLMNLALNYLLIFGKFGAPKLGVAGAAVATVISRYAECIIVVLWAHLSKRTKPYLKGAYRSFKIPGKLVRDITVKGMPLVLNETLYAAAFAVLLSIYSQRGIEAIAAYNITTTVSNVFNVVYMALGISVSIVIGQMLGAQNIEEAKRRLPQLMIFSIAVASCVAVVMLIFAPLIPKFYNTTADVKVMAAALMRINALYMPFYTFVHASYFIIRAGGRTVLTFFFDCGMLWCVYVPVALLLVNFTGLSLVWVYLLVQGIEVIRCLIGGVMLKKGVWAHNIIS